MGSHDEISLIYLAFIKESIPVLELDFRVKGREFHSAMFTGIASAVSIYLQEFTSGEVKVIDQGDIKIGFEEGTISSIIYMTNSITLTLQKKIRLMLKTFEIRFYDLLLADLIDHNVFAQFTEYVIETFAEELIKDYYIPFFVESSFKNSNLPDLAIPDEAWGILSFIDGKNTVISIIDQSKERKDYVIEMLALLRAQKLIDFEISLSLDDIPILTTIGTQFFFKESIHYEGLISMFGETSLDVIKRIDGVLPVSVLVEKEAFESQEIHDLLKYLLWKGYIQILTAERKYCSIIEYYYNLVLSLASKELGWTSERFFQSIRRKPNPITDLIFLLYDRISFDRLRIYSRDLSGSCEKFVFELLTSLDPVFEELNKLSEDGSFDYKKETVNSLTSFYGSETINLILNYYFFD